MAGHLIHRIDNHKRLKRVSLKFLTLFRRKLAFRTRVFLLKHEIEEWIREED